MEILHLNVAGIVDKFYDLFFHKISKIENTKQTVYIPYRNKEYVKTDFTRFEKYDKTINVIFSPIKRSIDRILFVKKIKKYANDFESKTKRDIQDYDIIHAHSMFSDGGVAYLLNKKYQIPYIVAIRRTDTEVFIKYFIHLRPLMMRILRHASFVVFINPSSRKKVLSLIKDEEFRNQVEKKSSVIPNGLDDFWLQNINNKKGNSLPCIRIIQVGKLIGLKNQQTTILAAKDLIERGYDVRLDLVGEGKNRKKLEKIVLKERMNKNVFFQGFVSDKKELMKLYRNADFFVLPSHSETFGLVYVEAMSQGLPIIYSRDVGFDGYFNEFEVGCSVASTSYKEIANAILKISNSYEEISKRCSDNSSKFNWDSIIETYQNIYVSILEKDNK